MTETEWLECSEPQQMLAWLRSSGKGTERKLRLFAVACCIRVEHLIPDALGHQAITVAARYADKLDSERDLWAIADQFCPCGVYNADYGHPATRATHYALYPQTVNQAATHAVLACKRPEQTNERAVQAGLLRDIFGNPFLSVTINQAWLTSNSAALADSIYAERAFERMPILADALEEAGCTSSDILNHLRSPGGHVRGCWTVDLCLCRD